VRRLAFVLALILAAPLWAAEPPVARLSGPKAVEVGSPIVLNPAGSAFPGGLEFGVASGPGPAPVVALKSDDGQTVIGFGTAAASGTYVFYVVAWGENVPNGRPAHSFAFWTVQVGEVPPPVPPGPGPGPGPGPDPFGGGTTAAPAFRCLIVYESADLSKLPPAQLTAITSAAVRDYLNAHCVAGPDGKTKEWRVWDQNVNTANESPMWQKVMARSRASVPWIVIGNGTSGYEGPLPQTTDAVLALLRKYGGN
jgi:hypothetical protein